MLSVLLNGLVIFFSFLLQTAVFPGLLPLRVYPNLLIIVTAACGFMKEENAGVIAGFFCGLLYDVFFGGVIGFHALLYTYVGFLNGKFARVFYPEDVKLPLILTTVSDFLYGFLSYVFMFLLRTRLDTGYYTLHIILPEIVYTLIVTIVLYRPVLFIEQWLEVSEDLNRTDV